MAGGGSFARALLQVGAHLCGRESLPRPSVLLCGLPGTGKTVLALRFPGILPPMSPQSGAITNSRAARLADFPARHRTRVTGPLPDRIDLHVASWLEKGVLAGALTYRGVPPLLP